MHKLSREQLRASLNLSVSASSYETEGICKDGEPWYLTWDRDVLSAHDSEYEITCDLTVDQMRGLHAALTLRLLDEE